MPQLRKSSEQMLEVLGISLLLLSWIFIAAFNKKHREETGVNMPSRGAMKGIRRRARKKGISEAEYYSEWVARKQKREGIASARTTAAKITKSDILPTLHKRHPEDLPQLMMIAKLYGFKIRTDEGGYILALGDNSHARNPCRSEYSTTFAPDELRAFLHSL